MAAPIWIRIPTLVVACIVATVGCKVSWYEPYAADEAAIGVAPHPTHRSGSKLAASDSPLSEDRESEPVPSTTATADTAGNERLAEYEAAMQEVLSELAEIRAIDPAAQESLMNDLRESDPAMWPILVRHFRSALEFRRQRDTAAPSGLAGSRPAVQLSDRNPTTSAAHRIAAHRQASEPFPRDPAGVVGRPPHESRDELEALRPDNRLVANLDPPQTPPWDQPSRDHRDIAAQAQVGDLDEPSGSEMSSTPADNHFAEAAADPPAALVGWNTAKAIDPRHQSATADQTHEDPDRTASTEIDPYVTQVVHQRPVADRQPNRPTPQQEQADDGPLDIGLALGVREPKLQEAPPSSRRLNATAAQPRGKAPLAVARREPRGTVPPANASARTDHQLTPRQFPAANAPVAAADSPPEAALSWAEHLDQAIAQLELEATDEPRTEEEARQQALLRMLYVVAGRKEQALERIAGVSHRQQDYWSTQMRALTTYLDERAEQDVRERATTAYGHLVDATQLMGEMGKLSVDNLAFCSSVSSFGVYEAVAANEFSPGDRVLLYAEVSNYVSEPTSDGFRTILASSYQILDERGNRVDSGEFPEVEDPCRNRRRDFHIQYGVELPERIYADRYRLELLIEDRLSGKIGRASIYFDIVERSGS